MPVWPVIHALCGIALGVEGYGERRQWSDFKEIQKKDAGQERHHGVVVDHP